MSNPSKNKGDQAERDVAHWITDHRGYKVERVRSGRATDAGDLTWPANPWHLDVKNQKRWRVQEWFNEAETEAARDDLQPLLIAKRPGITDPGRWLAVVRLMDLEL